MTGHPESPQEILEAICLELKELFPVAGSCVNELLPDGERFRIMAACGCLASAAGRTFSVEGSVSGAALRSAEGFWDNDLAASDTGREARRIVPDARRALAVAIRDGGASLGTLAVTGQHDAPPFDERDAAVLQALAVPAGFAMRYARLHEEDHELLKRFEALQATSLDLGTDRAIDEVLEMVARRGRTLVRARHAALAVLKDDGTWTDRFVTAGLPAEGRNRIGPPPSGHGLLGAALREGRPVRLGNVADDPRTTGTPAGHPPVTSFLGVPIRFGDRTFGYLYFTGRIGARGFTDDDQLLAEMLAAQAGTALWRSHRNAEHAELVGRLARAHAHQQRLTSFVSHDVRNALAGIGLWAQRLKRELARETSDTEALRNIAEKIGQGSERALRLAQDPLYLSLLEIGGLELRSYPVRVADAVREAVDASAPGADLRTVTLRASWGVEGLKTRADPDRVVQIVTNLVENAMKFSPAGEVVSVDVDAPDAPPSELRDSDGAFVCIRVRDLGPGMPSAERERIFGPFDAPGAVEPPPRRKPGTGVGLTLSLHLARQMGGTITVDSAPGRGSCFSVWLPRAEDSP